MAEMIRRGDVWLADLGDTVGAEKKGIRPVLIVQNDMGNLYSPLTIVLCMTTKINVELPTHVLIERSEENGLNCDSVIQAEQIRALDKTRLYKKLCGLTRAEMLRVEIAMKVSLELADWSEDE